MGAAHGGVAIIRMWQPIGMTHHRNLEVIQTYGIGIEMRCGGNITLGHIDLCQSQIFLSPYQVDLI